MLADDVNDTEIKTEDSIGEKAAAENGEYAEQDDVETLDVKTSESLVTT